MGPERQHLSIQESLKALGLVSDRGPFVVCGRTQQAVGDGAVFPLYSNASDTTIDPNRWHGVAGPVKNLVPVCSGQEPIAKAIAHDIGIESRKQERCGRIRRCKLLQPAGIISEHVMIQFQASDLDFHKL